MKAINVVIERNPSVLVVKDIITLTGKVFVLSSWFPVFVLATSSPTNAFLNEVSVVNHLRNSLVVSSENNDSKGMPIISALLHINISSAAALNLSILKLIEENSITASAEASNISQYVPS